MPLIIERIQSKQQGRRPYLVMSYCKVPLTQKLDVIPLIELLNTRFKRWLAMLVMAGNLVRYYLLAVMSSCALTVYTNKQLVRLS